MADSRKIDHAQNFRMYQFETKTMTTVKNGKITKTEICEVDPVILMVRGNAKEILNDDYKFVIWTY